MSKPDEDCAKLRAQATFRARSSRCQSLSGVTTPTTARAQVLKIFTMQLRTEAKRERVSHMPGEQRWKNQRKKIVQVTACQPNQRYGQHQRHGRMDQKEMPGTPTRQHKPEIEGPNGGAGKRCEQEKSNCNSNRSPDGKQHRHHNDAESIDLIIREISNGEIGRPCRGRSDSAQADQIDKPRLARSSWPVGTFEENNRREQKPDREETCKDASVILCD